VQRSVEAASKSRGAATPTSLLCLLLREEQVIVDHYGVFLLYAQTHGLLTVLTLTRLCDYACTCRGPRRVIRIRRSGAWCYLTSCIRTVGVVVTLCVIMIL
jgi:hypothetical protein